MCRRFPEHLRVTLCAWQLLTPLERVFEDIARGFSHEHPGAEGVFPALTLTLSLTSVCFHMDAPGSDTL